MLIEDHRPIELATETSSKPFEYRSLGLAGDGDFLVVSHPRDREYEAYMRDVVGLGSPTVLEVPADTVRRSRRLADAALGEEVIVRRLVEAARQHGGINLIPFISTGDVWNLGREIARLSRFPVRVTGPPPTLAARVNDKIWFSAFVRELIGRHALPYTGEAYGLASASASIKRMAEGAKCVVVKIPASAGAAGNFVFPVAAFSGKGLADIRAALAERLYAVGWRGHFPLLLGEWEQGVTASPSVQVWIPAQDQGVPVIEGVFAQSICGESGTYVGAGVAELAGPVLDDLVRETSLVSLALQHLGYFGRLSLDTIVVHGQAPRVHWIEANARWGGVSIPMTIAGRISQEPLLAGSFLTVQRSGTGRKSAHLGDILAELGPSLVSLPGGRREGLFFLLPPQSRYLVFSILGLPRAEARDLAKHTISLCLGLDIDSAQDDRRVTYFQ